MEIYMRDLEIRIFFDSTEFEMKTGKECKWDITAYPSGPDKPVTEEELQIALNFMKAAEKDLQSKITVLKKESFETVKKLKKEIDDLTEESE